MCVRNEADVIERCLTTIKPLIDYWTVVDTGSEDRTPELVTSALDGIPGNLITREWRGFGDTLTDAFSVARGTADWLIRCDADMTVEWDEALPAWLDTVDQIDAFMCTLVSGRMRWQLPMLVRGDQEWTFREPVHTWLDTTGRRVRVLRPAGEGGLTFKPWQDGARGRGEGATQKFLNQIKELEPRRAEGHPRSTFYIAQALRYLGHLEEAKAVYDERAAMTDGWEEERWYAAYQAAKLAGDVDQLLAVHTQRPWRHEPLTEAARITANRPHPDKLFLEQTP